MILHEPEQRDESTRVLPRFIPPNGDIWPRVEHWTGVEWAAWMRQSGYDDDRITHYLTQERYRYGYGLLPNGQRATVENAAEATWLYLPTPTAVSLHRTRELNIANTMWGGAVGGTKSYSALWEAFECSDDPNYENFRAIVMRRELEELRRTHLDKAELFADLINQKRGRTSIRVTKQPNAIIFEDTGAKIICGHCHALGDERKYLSEEYELFIADQAEEFYPQQLVEVNGRVRSTKDIPERSIYLPNPGGPAHLWLQDHFITKVVEDEPLYDPADYTYIHARLYDNPWLMGRDGRYTRYEKRLMQHKPKRRAQLLDGNWQAVVGQFFESYDGDESVRHVTLPPRCDVEVWFRSGEGGKVPYACWAVCLPDGRIHIIAELLMPHMTIGACAYAIVTATEDRVLPQIRARWNRSIASADIFPTDKDTGESPVETCRRNRFNPIEGDSNDIFGWQRLKHWFALHPLAGQPWLTVHPDCAFMTRTIPTLTQDPDAPDIIDASGDTQAAHALRIGVMARPTPSFEAIPRTKAPSGVGEIHSLIQQERGGSRRGYQGGMIR